MLEVKVENCAGIDVGKKFLAVCVLTGPVDRKPAEEVRRFGTSVKELERLRAWLMEKKCTEAVMESRAPGLPSQVGLHNRYLCAVQIWPRPLEIAIRSKSGNCGRNVATRH
jgi:hypothetical protein